MRLTRFAEIGISRVFGRTRNHVDALAGLKAGDSVADNVLKTTQPSLRPGVASH